MRRQSVFSGSFHLTMVCLLSLVALLRAGAAEAADTPPGPTATEHAATVKAIAAAADRAASAATDAASSATTVAAAARGLVSALVPSTTPDTYPVKCAYVRQTGINAYLLNIWER